MGITHKSPEPYCKEEGARDFYDRRQRHITLALMLTPRFLAIKHSQPTHKSPFTEASDSQFQRCTIQQIQTLTYFITTDKRGDKMKNKHNQNTRGKAKGKEREKENGNQTRNLFSPINKCKNSEESVLTLGMQKDLEHSDSLMTLGESSLVDEPGEVESQREEHPTIANMKEVMIDLLKDLESSIVQEFTKEIAKNTKNLNTLSKKVVELGIIPVYHDLFALATPDLKTWYNPNYTFTVDNCTSHVVVYRIRFFFPHWIESGGKKSERCSILNLAPDPLLSYQVIDYLFAQCRSDFLSGRMNLTPSMELQEKCLALAVLDMMRLAQESNKTPKQILSCVNYKHCVPQNLRQSILKLGFLSRKRLRRRMNKSLKKIRLCTLSPPLIKLKYLVDLEQMYNGFGVETFSVRSPQGGGKYLFLRVSGSGGISWKDSDSEFWQPFCDFPDIVDIRITQVSFDSTVAEGRVVTITKQDKILEFQFPVLQDALSFVSLVDGYYRITTDSQHYFCEEVAPPRLKWNLENQCHGPIT
ncbi:tyrosine- kinase JAK3 [Pelobates cultripes]|nr:tyrosine- kinase JAK3 [Pelobates cultripes]